MKARLVENALELAGGGWHVLPVQPRGKRPLTAHGLKEASTDLALINAWWERWPDANVGIATGAVSGLVVLDVDAKAGGVASLREMLATHGKLPEGVAVRTGGGGAHLYFTHPRVAVPNSASKLGPGLDVRGDGGYVVAPPSVHASGAAYEWLPGRAPRDTTTPPLPDWLLQLMRPATTAGPAASLLAGAPGVAVAAGARNDHLARLAGRLRRSGSTAATIEVALLHENAERCKPPLPDDEVRAIARSVARYEPSAQAGLDPAQMVERLRTSALVLSTERIQAAPAPRDYLLTETSTGAGVLVRGKVGLLAARGGSGKTYALAQLAIAVATGTTWLGDRGWKAEQGRVLLVLGEEDEDEVVRRLHHAVRAAGLDGEAMAQVVRNVVALALCGQPVALTTTADENGSLPETLFAVALRSLVQQAAANGEPFTLVVLDPLSRFAGADVEKDNSAATRFVQTVETLTAPECGSPSVLVAHHLRKSSKDDDQDSADPIRGASALKDAVRWAALLQPEKRVEGAPELLRLRVVKTNHAAYPAALVLSRPDDGHGVLRVATPEEVEQLEATRGGGKAQPRGARVEALKPRVLQALAVQSYSGAALARALRARREDVLQACEELAAAGHIRRLGWAWSLVSNSGSQCSREPVGTGPAPVPGVPAPL